MLIFTCKTDKTQLMIKHFIVTAKITNQLKLKLKILHMQLAAVTDKSALFVQIDAAVISVCIKEQNGALL